MEKEFVATSLCLPSRVTLMDNDIQRVVDGLRIKKWHCNMNPDQSIIFKLLAHHELPKFQKFIKDYWVDGHLFGL